MATSSLSIKFFLDKPKKHS